MRCFDSKIAFMEELDEKSASYGMKSRRMIIRFSRKQKTL